MDLEGLAREVVAAYKEAGLMLVLAESCTAGLAAATLGSVSGASGVLWGSFVTYTVEAKAAMLSLDKGEISRQGAVSAETARAMAQGALRKSGADRALSVTGIAGPLSDESGLPPGTVWIGWAPRGSEARAELHHFSGGRQQVREQAVEMMFRKAIDIIKTAS